VVRVRRAPKRSRRRRRGGRGQRKGEASAKDRKPAGQGERRPEKERRGKAEDEKVRKPKQQRDDGEAEVDIEEQRTVVQGFLEGLVAAFGLEGRVESESGDDVITVRIVGEQTEALIGPKGSVMQAILELTRTIVQRKTQAGARIRLDIAGYMERRREALRIYAGRLAEQVVDEGGEIMLEPMNAADRKVVHDVIAEVDGVRSFSEGEEPERSVVIARDD
jgi:spoIIIJ-associated protein